MGIDIAPVPVTGLAENFSPIPLMPPPPLGSETVGGESRKALASLLSEPSRRGAESRLDVGRIGSSTIACRPPATHQPSHRSPQEANAVLVSESSVGRAGLAEPPVICIAQEPAQPGRSVNALALKRFCTTLWAHAIPRCDDRCCGYGAALMCEAGPAVKTRPLCTDRNYVQKRSAPAL